TGPVSLAGVMGGESTEVHPGTRNVLYEAAHWDPVAIARTARRHKLPSEAAKRWERGVDPALPLVALERAVALQREYGGGTVDPDVLDADYVRPREAIRIAADLPTRTAGVAYSTERVVEVLEEIGCAVTVAGQELSGTPPTWRPDLTAPPDLAEAGAPLDGSAPVPGPPPVAPP